MSPRTLVAAALLATAAYGAAPAPVEMLKSAAAAGDAAAQFELARDYQLGQGVAADPANAIMWYRRAAAQGHAQAGDELGLLLFSRGDLKPALPYIERAAARGDARALYLLGTAHFNGDLAERNWPLAYAQTFLAARAGLRAAKANLGMMERYLLPADLAKADALLATMAPVRTPGAPAAVDPPPPPPAVPAPAPARPTGPWRVQLGAFGSAARARIEWDALARKVPELAKLDRRILAAGSIQRLQAAGLASRAQAQALCGRVRAARRACLAIGP